MGLALIAIDNKTNNNDVNNKDISNKDLVGPPNDNLNELYRIYD